MSDFTMPECTCEPLPQDAGGGYTEMLSEYDPGCPQHSYHVYDPIKQAWVVAKHPHQISFLEDGTEICDTCRNVNGDAIEWDQTWHALHKDKARQVQHCWRPAEPGSSKLVPQCGEPGVTVGMGLNTKEEGNAVPVCPKCHRLAMAYARIEEWDKVTSEEGIRLFKSGWHIGLRKGLPKTKTGLQRIREMIGR